jgi:hypothetical protein
LSERQRDHWLSVIQNPRRVVSAWHTLKWIVELQRNADIFVSSQHLLILTSLGKWYCGVIAPCGRRQYSETSRNAIAQQQWAVPRLASPPFPSLRSVCC